MQEQMARLRGACQKLQGEKQDLLDNLSKMHADAQARRELSEVQARLATQEALSLKLETDLASYHQQLGTTTEQMNRLHVLCEHQKEELTEVCIPASEAFLEPKYRLGHSEKYLVSLSQNI